MKESLQEALGGVRFGEPESAEGALKSILSNPVIFAANLYETPLAGKIEAAFRDMLIPGGVRKSLQKV
jgi:fructuronate reductase